jgi:hypothetical protein
LSRQPTSLSTEAVGFPFAFIFGFSEIFPFSAKILPSIILGNLSGTNPESFLFETMLTGFILDVVFWYLISCLLCWIIFRKKK